MFPLLLNLNDRLCLVVGGGPVGRRKAAALLAAGARVRLVCLEPQPPASSQPTLEWLTEPFRPVHLKGSALVFAAGPPEVNRQVADAAKLEGIWVNVADDPSGSDFFVPATLRRGDFVLAISTGGASPALARRIRQRLESQMDEAFGRWAALLAELRPLVRDRIADVNKRRRLWRQLTRWHWLGKLRRQSTNDVRLAMLARIDVLATDSQPEV
jgi:precorrin-2 dehydrogenase/sirohydrochlorin ferrochelatase